MVASFSSVLNCVSIDTTKLSAPACSSLDTLLDDEGYHLGELGSWWKDCAIQPPHRLPLGMIKIKCLRNHLGLERSRGSVPSLLHLVSHAQH